MLFYILKRLGFAVITLWLVITITFIVMHTIPGNPFRKEGNMPPGVYENLQRYYNLDRPYSEQYFIYLKSILRLDFGPSLKSSVITVNDYIKKSFPVSFYLGVQALALAVTAGLILGVAAALYHNKWPDYLSMMISVIGISVPSFIMATLLINYMAVEWNILPAATWTSWRHTILPTISLAMMPLAYTARIMRSSLLSVMSQDYIRTARAKGLSQSTVVIRHALRNAIMPVVSLVGILSVNLVTGSFIIERIFGIPGMGNMFVKSIINRDYPVILGGAVFYSAVLIFATLIIDIVYTLIDPRIKISGGES